MAKITRVNGNVKAFGSSQASGERTLFGQTTVSDDLTAQFTTEFLRGWGIVGASDFPKLQDFNAATFTNGQLLAYLHQMGLPEYNAAQEFYLNSITQFNGVLYMSIQDGNTGRQPNTNPTWWKPLLPIQATELVAGILKISTQALALAGADDTTSMTPLKVKQALDQRLPFVPVESSPGDIVITSANAAPPGALKANGSAVSRTTYAALFAKIGTTYGAGDGSTTFNLPEARAEGIRGWDDGRGVDAGRALGSAQLDSVRSIGIYSETGNPFGGGGGTGAGYLKTSSSGAVIIPPGTETRGRNIAFLICIRY